MKYLFTLICIASTSVLGTVNAQTPKVTCTFNSVTKQLEPTKAWQELLGDEAFEACKKITGASNKVQAKLMPGVAVAANPVAPAMPLPQAMPISAQGQIAVAAPVNLEAMNNRREAFLALRANAAAGTQTMGTPPPLPVFPLPQTLAKASPAKASPPPSKPMVQEKAWQVDLKDITLSTTFARWANDAGYRVRWDADKNVIVDAPDNITGTFEDAVTTVLSSPGITDSVYPLEVCFYANTPPLARITRKGEQKDCK